MYDETKNQRDILITQNDEQMMISVDCCIADLIEKLNNHGFYTEYCCSGHEEDAFLSMYIKFCSIDSTRESMLRDFVTNFIDELYVEDDYEISTTVDISCNYVQLTDPTPEEMQMALKIVFRDRINDEELVKRDISHNITIRAQCCKDYIESHHSKPEDWNEFVMINKTKVMRGIKKLEFFIDNLESL